MGLQGCCAEFGKFILVIFNILFWFCGAGLLAVGIWMLVDKNISSYITVLSVLDGSGNLLNYAAYVLIGAGAFIFMVGFFGCCGAWKESRFMLGLYIFFLVIIIGIELTAAVLGLLFKDTISAEAGKIFNTTVVEKWGKSSQADKDFTYGVSLVQIEGRCCGWEGPYDFISNGFSGDKLPLSCCALTDPCGKSASELTTADAWDWNKCKTLTDTYFHSEGCAEKLEAWVDDNYPILVGVTFGIIGLQIIICIFAICLCRNIGDKH